MNALACLLAAAVLAPMPAAAQFSRGYKFLEAVRKKKGDEVQDELT